MVNQCANPNCRKPLHYLRDGRVFLFSRKNSAAENRKLPHRLEHYWLCGTCVKEWTLQMDNENGVKLVENKKRAGRVRAPYGEAPLATASGLG